MAAGGIGRPLPLYKLGVWLLRVEWVLFVLASMMLVVVLAIQLAATGWDMVEPYDGVFFATILLGVPLIVLRSMLGRDGGLLSRYYTDELVSMNGVSSSKRQ